MARRREGATAFGRAAGAPLASGGRSQTEVGFIGWHARTRPVRAVGAASGGGTGTAAVLGCTQHLVPRASGSVVAGSGG